MGMNREGDVKCRSTNHFVENSDHIALKIDLLLTVLNDFERKETLQDIAF